MNMFNFLHLGPGEQDCSSCDSSHRDFTTRCNRWDLVHSRICILSNPEFPFWPFQNYGLIFFQSPFGPVQNFQSFLSKLISIGPIQNYKLVDSKIYILFRFQIRQRWNRQNINNGRQYRQLQICRCYGKKGNLE